MLIVSSPRRRLRSTQRWVAVAVLATLASLSLVASPAGAAGNLDTDDVRLDGGRADFGNNPHVFGGPSQPGTVSWSGDSLTGPVTARVQGLLYHDDLFTGRCVRIRVVWERADLTDLRETTRSLCRSGGGLAARTVDVSFQSAAVRFVFISVQVQQPDGSWRTEGPRATRRVAFLD